MIAELLAQSRAAHRDKKKAAGTVDKTGQVTSAPDYPTAESHIAKALRLREQAEALDPVHTDPAWATDQAANKGVTSAELLGFFRAYLEMP